MRECIPDVLRDAQRRLRIHGSIKAPLMPMAEALQGILGLYIGIMEKKMEISILEQDIYRSYSRA